ncbi:uncharacterized protein EI90DRAFT_1453530 [Cantharellus anzutake]|uniref:uncharacterized protein n=1 Tax=Cantharellus anzutake TaxID=1750568 RepID=UPI0019073007|nr:uncharacterized protein EI90DRAFT_1453530 [Cantharellus anzutake]KAF8329147.1 hypothetical protein EI90DRAFT_1453530 [Cantharellus anzutake]
MSSVSNTLVTLQKVLSSTAISCRVPPRRKWPDNAALLRRAYFAIPPPLPLSYIIIAASPFSLTVRLLRCPSTIIILVHVLGPSLPFLSLFLSPSHTAHLGPLVSFPPCALFYVLFYNYYFAGLFAQSFPISNH